MINTLTTGFLPAEYVRNPIFLPKIKKFLSVPYLVPGTRSTTKTGESGQNSRTLQPLVRKQGDGGKKVQPTGFNFVP